eukprot:13060006-Ditylum_brightwellii.AAC.1
MKINHKSLEFANCNQGNKPPPIPFYVPDKEKKLSPMDYQTYKLQTNQKDEKSTMFNLVVKYYKVGTTEGVATVYGYHYKESTEGRCLTGLQEQRSKSGDQGRPGVY